MKPADAPAAETRSASAAKETFMLRSFSFFSYTTTAVVVSYFPLYFLDRGFTEQQIGIIYSTGPFISIFANLLTGMISDKYRTIKKLLMLLLLGQLAMIALLFPLDQFALICAAMIGFYFFRRRSIRLPTVSFCFRSATPACRLRSCASSAPSDSPAPLCCSVFC
ncbi:hypothetical protein PACILC2_16210 [Paenibacillus cisolokensis]|uniref:Major facilitator superfamily associated domain-containing protein n=1 Tax=Paenibacillus cisolokensis TaxID=1658519 RepID=A0ABQ4N4B1_9BACL|nr:MFS transporter [Paenibacillus cisolokensis]GIQ63053.1 hypothetical protein PACILC2_16210 [Paenibacillus cisolokensis]